MIFMKSNFRLRKESNPLGKVSKHNLKSNQGHAMAYMRIWPTRYGEQKMEMIMGILSTAHIQYRNILYINILYYTSQQAARFLK